MGEKMILDITDISDEGSGVGKSDGITVFTDSGIPMDKLEVEITNKKKNYMQAKTKRIIKKSPLREDEKICEIQDICGGCSLLDMKYEEQVKYKKNMVVQKLMRIGKIENPPVRNVVGMQEPFHYRNKTQMPVTLENGEIKIGFYKKNTHDIIPFKTCKIQETINDRIIEIVKRYVKAVNLHIYDEKTHTGVLRHIITKISHNFGEIMLILVTNSDKKTDVGFLVKEFEKSDIPVTSIIQNINKKDTNVILGEKNRTLFGKDFIKDKIEDLTFNIYPNSFYQVNSLQMEKMYQKAIEYSGVKNTDVVYDLYCGIGTISLLFAKRAAKVYGIEVVSQAIKSADENKEQNGIKNASFICGKVEDKISGLLQNSQKPDIVVLDPARKGCEQSVLEKIVETSPRKIVYISCNPSTLARDLQIILASGKYKLDEITPFDLFCNTMHVETVALIQRVES